MNNRGVVRNVRTPAKAAVGQRFVCMSGAEDSKDEEEDAPKEPSMPIAKASEFRGMSREDMLEEIAKCKNALFDLRMKQSTRQEVKNDQFKKLRKKVAVIRTVMREQELAQGISKRDSRKIKYWERKNNMYV
mmetsp:Transcript_5012/g.18192  ORF Transcript_5012/g.18192 Transcript_5012/m.18192 type:complete len:132 (+) Transcript_5012:527-922(+)